MVWALDLNGFGVGCFGYWVMSLGVLGHWDQSLTCGSNKPLSPQLPDSNAGKYVLLVPELLRYSLSWDCSAFGLILRNWHQLGAARITLIGPSMGGRRRVTGSRRCRLHNYRRGQ